LAYGTLRSRGDAPAGVAPVVRSKTILIFVLALIAAAAAAFFLVSLFVLDDVNPRSSSLAPHIARAA